MYRLAADYNVQGQGCAPGLAGCGCACNQGLGLFETGTDFTGWSWPEWAVVGIGLYTLFSFVGDTKRGVARVGRVSKAVKRAI